jgi:predicted CoA-binding protein
MSDEACPMPRPPSEDELSVIRRLLQAQRIAIVGASHKPEREAHYVPEYLQSAGKQVLPVNPRYQEVLGVRCYPDLASVPRPIDLVNVFRNADACPQVVREAIAAGARGVWLQSGIVSPEAERLARDAGLDFVQDRCLMVEHRRGAR